MLSRSVRRQQGSLCPPASIGACGARRTLLRYGNAVMLRCGGIIACRKKTRRRRLLAYRLPRAQKHLRPLRHALNKLRYFAERGYIVLRFHFTAARNAEGCKSERTGSFAHTIFNLEAFHRIAVTAISSCAYRAPHCRASMCCLCQKIPRCTFAYISTFLISITNRAEKSISAALRRRRPLYDASRHFFSPDSVIWPCLYRLRHI